MTGHLEATATVTCGNDTEGIKLDNTLVENLFPQASDAHVASGLRDSMRLAALQRYIALNPQVPYAQAVAFVDEHAEDTH